MAVQKSKVTRSRRGQRRSHDALTGPTLAQDVTLKMHQRVHCSSPRGRISLENIPRYDTSNVALAVC